LAEYFDRISYVTGASRFGFTKKIQLKYKEPLRGAVLMDFSTALEMTKQVMKPPSAETVLFWIPAFAGMTSDSRE